MSRRNFPTRLRDQRGNDVHVEAEPLAVGGEGAIFSVVGRPECVAKLYHKPGDAKRGDKLRAMARLCNPDLLKVAAWPTAVLSAGDPSVVEGILMPRIRGFRELHHLYSVAQRKKDFPDADWGFLLHTARNCAIAFETVHRHGHVVGDVNQKNVMVSEGGIIAFVDCDSFQVAEGGRVHRCEVGVQEYTPPELHGKSFASLDREPNHDLFGLAVLIFHLLMLGRHPFAGVPTGAADLPLEAAIRERCYAYTRNTNGARLKPPPHAPPASMLGPGILDLFERAFVSQRRPTAAEWQGTIDVAMRGLARCKHDPHHCYPSAAERCPWCELIATSRLMAFLPGHGAAARIQPEEFDRLLEALKSLDLSFPAYSRPVLTRRVKVTLPAELHDLLYCPLPSPHPAKPSPPPEPRLDSLPSSISPPPRPIPKPYPMTPPRFHPPSQTPLPPPPVAPPRPKPATLPEPPINPPRPALHPMPEPPVAPEPTLPGPAHPLLLGLCFGTMVLYPLAVVAGGLRFRGWAYGAAIFASLNWVILAESLNGEYRRRLTSALRRHEREFEPKSEEASDAGPGSNRTTKTPKYLGRGLLFAMALCPLVALTDLPTPGGWAPAAVPPGFLLGWCLLKVTHARRRLHLATEIRRHQKILPEIARARRERREAIVAANEALDAAWIEAQNARAAYEQEYGPIAEQNRRHEAEWEQRVAELKEEHERAVKNVEAANRRAHDRWKAAEEARFATHDGVCRAIDRENASLQAAWERDKAAREAALAQRRSAAEAAYREQRATWERDVQALNAAHEDRCREIDRANEQVMSAWRAKLIPLRAEADRWRTKAAEHAANIERLERELFSSRRDGVDRVAVIQSAAKADAAACAALLQDYRSERRAAEADSRAEMLKERLESHLIRDAGLKSLGNERILALESFDIETAADVELLKTQKVPGIGQGLQIILETWRDSLASTFSPPDASPSLPDSEARRISARHAPALLPLRDRIARAIREAERLASARREADGETLAAIAAEAARLAAANARAKIFRQLDSPPNGATPTGPGGA